jgi:hypothetical protein
LHPDSSTGTTTDFTNTQLQAGRTFQAHLDALLAAVKSWEDCLSGFQKAASPLTRPATIPDGNGPVAHHLGTRFNHRLGVQGGVGYAADAYVKQFVAILEGLTQSAQNYAAVEERNTATITGQAGQSGVAQP